MKRLILSICFFSLLYFISQAQSVGVGTASPDASAIFDVTATGKGMLVPRMSFANRPTSPATGLLYYQTDVDSGFYYYNGIDWKLIKQDPLIGNGSNGRIAIWDGAKQMFSSSKLLFDTSTVKMSIGSNTLDNNTLLVNGAGGVKINSTNNATGTTDWIASNVGGTVGDRVVSGVLFGTASIGGHNNDLNAWTEFSINAGGTPVGIGTSNPNNSALLDLQSTTSGLLVPRMNKTERNVITSPANGLMIMQTDEKSGLYRYKDTSWRYIPDASLDVVMVNPTTLDTVINFNNSIEGNRIINLNANNINGIVPINNLPTNVVRGTGTTNYVPRFGAGGTGVAGIVNSSTQDNGTGISIGNSGPIAQYQAYIYRQQLTSTGDGQSALHCFRTRDSQNDGTGYGNDKTNRASSSMNFWGDTYTFGNIGYSFNDFTRTGGSLGADVNGTYWSSAGYRSSAFMNYGLYATAALETGAGRSNVTTPAKGIGGGFVGDLMGAWFKGKVMGSISEGKLFASYNVGNTITDGRNIELVTTANGEKLPTYSVSTASEAKIYHDGAARLSRGKARINFTPEFLATLDKNNKPTITISPVGGWANIYIAKIDSRGFEVAEANNGRSNIDFNYIVVGKKSDYNTLPLSSEVLNKSFSENLPSVMFNEGNTEDSAQPMWWDGSKIQYSKPPLNSKEIEAQERKKEIIKAGEKSDKGQ